MRDGEDWTVLGHMFVSIFLVMLFELCDVWRLDVWIYLPFSSSGGEGVGGMRRFVTA